MNPRVLIKDLSIVLRNPYSKQNVINKKCSKANEYHYSCVRGEINCDEFIVS